MKRMLNAVLYGIAAAALCWLLASAALAENVRFTSLTELAGFVRAAMVNRADAVTFDYEVPYAELGGWSQETLSAFANRFLDELSALLFVHTGNGAEGDYLDAHRLDYNMRADVELTGNKQAYLFHMEMRFAYRTTAAEESAVADGVRRVLAVICPPDMDDAAKIRAIYAFICGTVAYDDDGLARKNDPQIYSAYAALIRRAAVCEGYASLFYRMALEAGVDCRMVFGSSFGEAHAWNIVRVNGTWYQLDATWDAGVKDWKWFLKGEACADHEPDPAYVSAAFTARHPLAKSDYTFADPGCAHRFADVDMLRHAASGTPGEVLTICTRCGVPGRREARTDVLPLAMPKPELPGDVDANHSVEAADARLALRIAVNLEPTMCPGTLAYAAANVEAVSRGFVNASDARLILRKAVDFNDPEFGA